MAVESMMLELGTIAPQFALPDTEGAAYSTDDFADAPALLVMFICNHCPYVQSIIDRIVRDAQEMQAAGIGVVAISANDVSEYPQDGPDQMKAEAERRGFTFPYLYDEAQDVARAYGAECTPDFFGYNAEGKLQYRGRFDASARTPGPIEARRELLEAMLQISETGKGPEKQVPSMGCSIKWKAT